MRRVSLKWSRCSLKEYGEKKPLGKAMECSNLKGPKLRMEIEEHGTMERLCGTSGFSGGINAGEVE